VTRLLFILLLLWPAGAFGETGLASWYSRASCKAEGTSGVMANRRPLDDRRLTCASWNYPLGTRLQVSAAGGRKIVCVVTDRGPGKGALRAGVVIDLSRAAFLRLAPLAKGRVKVTVTEMRRAR